MVPEADRLVSCWRGDGRPVPPGELGLHITVLWPFLQLRRPGRRLAAELVELFATVPSFEFALTAVGRFPDVLFLRPEPADPFRALTDLVSRRWPHCQPYGGAYPEVIPHLTVAAGRPSPADTGPLERALPIRARAAEVALAAPDRHGRWQILTTFPLGVRTVG